MNTGGVTNMNSKYTTFFRFLFEENYQNYINKTKMKTANYSLQVQFCNWFLRS